MTLQFESPQAKPPALAGALTWDGSGCEWTAVCAGHANHLQSAAAEIGARVVEQAPLSLDEIFLARSGATTLRKLCGVNPCARPLTHWPGNSGAPTAAAGCSCLPPIPLCAVLYRVLAESIQASDGWRSLSFMPFAISLILAAAFCNFTDRSRRDGLAGFPRHLFTLPVKTHYLVTLPDGFAAGEHRRASMWPGRNWSTSRWEFNCKSAGR